jgi:hypothetical protein
MRYFCVLLLALCSSVAWGGDEVPLGDVYPVIHLNRAPSTAVPTNIGGSPAIDVYEDGSATPITGSDGTFTVSHNSVVGLAHCDLTCSTENGYEVGKWYTAVISGTTPTSDSISIAGTPVAKFRVVAAEAAAGVSKVDVSHWLGSAASTLLTATDVQNEAEDGAELAITTNRLDELMVADSDIDGAAPPTVGSVFYELMTKTTGSFTYDQTTDSLEATQDDATSIISAIAATPAAVWAEATRTLTSLGNGSGLSAIPWNAAWDAEVQSEAQDAIEANHLDHLLAADYDPANKPGVSTALLNELVENDGGVSRYTANALENAPAASGATVAEITGYNNVTRVNVGDNLETVIEAATAGDLIILEAGAHTCNATVAVPSGVDIRGAGIAATVVTGDPGSGADAIFVFAGRNSFDSFRIVNSTDGHCIALSASGACDVSINNMHLRGDDDCIAMYDATTPHLCKITNSIIDVSVWDGIAIAAADANLDLDNVVFYREDNSGATAAEKCIYIIGSGQKINITANNVRHLTSTRSGSGGAFLHATTTNAADAIYCEFNNVTTQCHQHMNITTTLAGTVVVRAAGNTNFDETTFVTAGAGFTYTDNTAAQQRVELATELARVDVATSTRASSTTLGTPAGASIAADIAAAKADTTTLTGRLTAPRAAALDNLDAAVSTRSTFTPASDALPGSPTAGTYAEAISYLDAAVSSAVSANTVTADRVAKQVTFYVGAEGNTSRNIVTLNDWSTGTRTIGYDFTELLNQMDTTLSTVDSVTVVKGVTSITTSNLRKHQNGKVAMWDTAAISSANTGTYVVTVTVTTTDSNTIVVTGTLEVE